MVSFEQAFSDTERAAEATRKAAADLVKQAKALERAAKTGNIATVRRTQDRLDDALSALRQEVARASSSWPFQDEEEQHYLNDTYINELRCAAEERGLHIYERDGLLISHPSIVRVLPDKRAVRVDRKQVSTIRPSHLAGLLLENQQKSSRYQSSSFLEALYGVYSEIASGESSGRLVKSSGPVVPLAKIYKLLTSLPGSRREYDRSDFARDLYTLDANGPTRTRRGAAVSFPSSSGTRRRSSDLFSFIGPDGQGVEYYGIRFTKDE